MTDTDEIDLDRLARGLSAHFGKRTIELAAASAFAYVEPNWRDAIVFVACGEVEVECASGERARFREGDILCLVSLHVRLLRNTGTAPAHLLAISRLGAHRRTG